MDSARAIITIGNFDGVHLGHAALLRRARQLARPTDRVLALVFDPHPQSTLRPGTEPPRLTTFTQRASLLLDAGADDVIRLEPSVHTLSSSPESFIDSLLERFQPRAFVEGTDFRFGRGRAGSLDTLRHLGASRGFDVHAVDPVTVPLADLSIVTASSTITRWLILHGRVDDAARVLGRPYQTPGTVVQGDRRGRRLGFPTANIHTPCLVPADGVYAGIATLPDGRAFPAAVSVGSKPTYPGAQRTLEAHLLDAPADGPRIAGLPEYGWDITLAFHAWIRDQVPFPDSDSLVQQLHRDCLRTRQLLTAHATP